MRLACVPFTWGTRPHLYLSRASSLASEMNRNKEPEPDLMSGQFPPVARFVAVATIAFVLVCLILVSFVFWVAATTGEPVILTPHRYGKAWAEAVLFTILLGVGCYGTAVLDWLSRR